MGWSAGLCVAQAVQIYGTDGLNHLAAPSDDPGWANVGSVAGASFVFLGSYDSGYWALSARHVVGDVDGLSFALAGQSYGAVAGSAIRLTNDDTSLNDLMLFRLSGDAALDALPKLTVASAPIALGDSIRFVGSGYQRAASLTYWNVAGTVWTERPGPGGSDATGYKWDVVTAKSWGDNTVSGINTPVDIGSGPTTAFATTFGSTNGSAMLAVGDSGGAAFRKVNGVWELAGINDAIGTFANQPAGTSVVGNLAYAADLSVYGSQIQSAIAIPEPGSWGVLSAGVALALAGVRRRVSRKSLP